jgi:FkbM family methyltransferase
MKFSCDKESSLKIIDLIWNLPYGRRTVLSALSKVASFDKRIEIELKNVRMEIDLTQILDMQYAYGTYDTEELEFLESYYQPGDSFIDIGANLGFYSLYLAEKFHDLRVLAFEPDPYNIAKFRKNISLNGAKNICLCEEAVGDDNCCKELMLNTGNNRGGNSFVVDQSQSCGETSTITVPCKTLFTSLIENDIQRVGIAKMDVEGYEYPILKKFFSEAPKSLYPRAIVIEAFGNNISLVGGSPIELLIRHDYELVSHTLFNFCFHLR